VGGPETQYMIQGMTHSPVTYYNMLVDHGYRLMHAYRLNRKF